MAALFVLYAALGVGTVGTVYRAESPDITEPVAVKLLHPTISHDDAIVDRCVSLTESTSPSGLLGGSLDAARRQAA